MPKMVEISWTPGGVMIEGVPAAVIAPILTASKKVFLDDMPGKYRQEEHPFFETSRDGSITFAQGLLPRVVERLAGDGWSISATRNELLVPHRGQIMVNTRHGEIQSIAEMAGPS